MSSRGDADVAAANRAERASSFARVAGEYERGRPGYPREAIEWLLGADPLEVLDLGAGTGKLTSALLDAGPPRDRGRAARRDAGDPHAPGCPRRERSPDRPSSCR